jgi:hypothetical protein
MHVNINFYTHNMLSLKDINLNQDDVLYGWNDDSHWSGGYCRQ